jgi:hypothetical protein
MGYNRSGARRKQKRMRTRKEAERLLKKMEQAAPKSPVTASADAQKK